MSLHERAIAAFSRGDPDRAVELLRQAADADPESPIPLNDLGNVLAQMGKPEEAVSAYRRAIEIAPAFPEAHNNLGNVYQMSGTLEPAVACYRRALSLRPDYAEAHRNLGSALRRLGRLEEAVAALLAAVALNPGYSEAVAQLVHQLKQLCDWRMVDHLTRQLIRAVEEDRFAVNPFVFLTLDTSQSQQKRCAEYWARRCATAAARPPLAIRNDRITLGYLSADFQEHAVALLISELFVLHDRGRFRVIGYSYGEDDGSAMRRRLRESFDAFVDLENVSHKDAAARIRADGVDILVDLTGYTTNARPEIAALRPAPIQVNYLGFPGTMGTDAIDYILADSFVIPPDQRQHFTEQVIYLPNCYQVNDRRRSIASPPSRADCGLPEAGFVFCCFSAAYKVTPAIFDIWVRLLGNVPGSVLWLLATNATANANLLREAEARLPGCSDRLVFAPTLPNPLHLARFAVADLFLDTLPYNAHTVTSDSLWGGCPVVTCAGETFASRVAGSILHAAGLPELVTHNLADYEALALRLARDPERLRTIRAKLQSSRLETPLFDTPRFARDMEAAFERMIGSTRG